MTNIKNKLYSFFEKFEFKEYDISMFSFFIFLISFAKFLVAFQYLISLINTDTINGYVNLIIKLLASLVFFESSIQELIYSGMLNRKEYNSIKLKSLIYVSGGILGSIAFLILQFSLSSIFNLLFTIFLISLDYYFVEKVLGEYLYLEKFVNKINIEKKSRRK